VVCVYFSCGLSVLATSTIPAQLTAATLANSMTLHLGDWLALPAVPLAVSLQMLRRELDSLNLHYLQKHQIL